MEDTQEQELRVESDRDSGGGYDPYGGSVRTSSRTAGAGSNTGPRNGAIPGPSRGQTNTTLSRSDPASAKNAGGGYDPYGKGVTSRPTRKR